MDNEVPMAVVEFMGKISAEILNPILGTVFGLAILFFLWGLMTFMFNGGDETKITLGKQHMLWGVIGMTVMVSVFAILAVVLATFEVGGEDLTDPNLLENTFFQ